LQIKTKIVSHHTADSKPIKQEVNGTVILPPLVFPAQTLDFGKMRRMVYHCTAAGIYLFGHLARVFLHLPTFKAVGMSTFQR